MHKSCAFFFTPCTIDADPLIVDFGSHHPRDVSDNPIKPNRPTMVTISCGDKVKRSVYLRVFPAIPPRGPNNYATLVHTDSNQPFKGLGLIYKYGEELRSCDQGQAWRIFSFRKHPQRFDVKRPYLVGALQSTRHPRYERIPHNGHHPILGRLTSLLI